MQTPMRHSPQREAEIKRIWAEQRRGMMRAIIGTWGVFVLAIVGGLIAVAWLKVVVSLLAVVLGIVATGFLLWKSRCPGCGALVQVFSGRDPRSCPRCGVALRD
jgi:uncharacterized membrane protein